MITAARIRGTLLGTAVGDALGMPVEGLSHQNVRTYYKGIKTYRADEERGDLEKGQWTDDTQLTFALVRAWAAAGAPEGWPECAAQEYVRLLPEARRWGGTTTAAVRRLAEGGSWEEAGDAARPTDGAAMRAAPLGLWWAATGASEEEAIKALRPVLEVTHRHPTAVAAGLGQAFAVQYAVTRTAAAFDAADFWPALLALTERAEERLGDAETPCSARLRLLSGHLSQAAMPLDLQDLCDGTGIYAHEAWPFAAAMFARAPHLLEATLLSAINVGGDADTVGAMTGALLGALHGWDAFPAAWREGLEARARLEEEADAFAEALDLRKGERESG